MYTLVLVRHGESEWNKKNLFTGWTDVGITPEGVKDARLMGKKLSEEGYEFPVAFTSVLKRASLTLELILEEMNSSQTQVIRDWRLNERHYGKLQGKSKIGILDELEWKQVHAFRRSYKTRPPQLETDDPRHPANDSKYSNVPEHMLPRGESLEDTYNRVIPYLQEEILPALKTHNKALISAHGNTLRVLLKYFNDLTDNQIEGVEFAIGEILVYRLDEDFKVISKEFIASKTNVKYGGDM